VQGTPPSGKMGRLIPSGTGFEYNRNVHIPPDSLPAVAAQRRRREPPPPPPPPSPEELELEREMEISWSLKRPSRGTRSSRRRPFGPAFDLSAEARSAEVDSRRPIVDMHDVGRVFRPAYSRGGGVGHHRPFPLPAMIRRSALQ
jgi:hypothetical protein